VLVVWSSVDAGGDRSVTLEFRVIGVAQQMGSKRAFMPRGWTRPIITDSNRNLKSWQQLVADGASRAIQALPPREQGLMTEAVRLTVAFYLPRPKSLPRRVLANVKAPDLDKLVRATADAINQVVFRDDAQIVDMIAMKRYAGPGDAPYAVIRVEPTAGVVPLAQDQPLFELAR
jgi:Holliday junction resolvase RusA-like endonuclease